MLAAFATFLQANVTKNGTSGLMALFAPSLAQALESLKNHTGARVGDRTVMDVLIPFTETLDSSRDFATAVQ